MLQTMKTVTLSATFDGQHIRLEEPYPLPVKARLLVTILPSEPDAEGAALLAQAAQGLARAYGESEPDYSAAFIEEPNPRYEGR